MRETTKTGVSEKTVIISDHHRYDVGETVIDKAYVNSHIVCITDPCSLASEQFKKLKARILKETTKQDFLNTMMVTSADMGEGKSLIATNLAVALSNEHDYTVLLVDADLRNPSVHNYFGIKQKYGLNDYLSGRVKLHDILIKTGIGKLSILPAGNPQENTTELLSSEKTKMLVQELKLRYKDRYIIFDSSPLLVTADALHLGSYMDGIIFVIQEGRTSQKSAIQAISLMKGWNILGVAFNNVPQYLIGSHYHYYYQQNPSNGKNHAETT